MIILAIFILALGLGLFLVWQSKRSFEIQSNQELNNQPGEDISQNSGPRNPITGLLCENGERRAVAVILSGDAVTRPLSGISQADLVFEMFVVEGSITRLMAVFICQNPTKIGSVRSARHDFIPLAAGLDAIYAHWGGSHFALDKLKTGLLDNLDALPNPYNVFYRQSGIEAPHNGFTSMTRILTAAKNLNYRLTTKFVGYPHLSEGEATPSGQERKTLSIDYPGSFGVSYQYNPECDCYQRFRGGTPEIDKNTGKPVEAKNVVIMRAQSQPLEGDYNDVQVEGEGKAEYYLNGQASKGNWKKDKKDPKSKLFFYDEKGQEVKFAPGSIWIEIVGLSQNIIYE